KSTKSSVILREFRLSCPEKVRNRSTASGHAGGTVRRKRWYRYRERELVRRSAMRHRYLIITGTAVVAAVVLLARVPVSGQTPRSSAPSNASGATKAYKAPRTAFGQPDFQGVWTNNTATPIERLKEF